MTPPFIILLLLGLVSAQERSISGGGSKRFSIGSEALDFNCPQDFGYYPHATDCTKYYVCVFGGALLESCNGGLMYSNELQTCDWPRNVVCTTSGGGGGSTAKIIDPRNRGRETNRIHSATESLTATGGLINQGLDDNTIRSREPVKTSGSSKSIFDDSKLRQGRFIPNQNTDHQRIDNGFQAEETASRSFNVVPTDQSPKSKFNFPPSLPTRNNRVAAPESTAVKTQDTVALTNDYYYYYDELLDDYYEPAITQQEKTTPKPQVRTSSRSRKRQEAKKFVPASVATSDVNSRSRGTARFPSKSPQSASRGPSRSFSSPSKSPSSSSQSLPSKSSSRSRSSGSRGGPSPASQDVRTSQRSSSRNSSSRGSSQLKPKASSKKTSGSGGSPKVVGRTPQRLVRPSKKPPPASSRTNLITDIWKFPPRRPTPVHAQPQANVPAKNCDRNTCQLPDCYCGGPKIPGNIQAQNVPQIVLLTFDDAVNDLNKKLYIDLFEKGRVNPNGCPISATFYISHEWTNYAQVQNLYADGHEIASHSITHSFGEQFSHKKWALEIGGQREILSAYAGVKMEDIRGMRAPFLAVGGNNMFGMLYDLNFTYDSSMPVYENNPPSWPYTLDYKIFHDCMIPPCPSKSYPGLWEVPMVMWQDLVGGRCSMGDGCASPPDAEGIYQMLVKNFERHYTTNRAPFPLFYHSSYFTTPHHKDGFITFLDTISAMDDVYIITNWQALQWVRNPVSISGAKSFKPFQCDYPDRPPRCETPRVCNVWHKGSVRYMKTCQTCPESFPWTGKTGVDSPLNNL